MEELKHVIALLLEDAKRLQQIEPNAGTEARIWLALKSLRATNHSVEQAIRAASLKAGNELHVRSMTVHQAEKCSLTISPQLQRLKKVISELEIVSNDTEAREKFLLELKLIEAELK